MNLSRLPHVSSAVDDVPCIDSLLCDGTDEFIVPVGPHALHQEVTIRLRGLAALAQLDVKLRTFPDGEERLIPMTPERKPPFLYWSAKVVLACSPFRFRFRIQTPRQVLWLSASGLHAGMPPADEDFRLVPGYQAPDWVAGSVLYQIFPDRFHCGRPETALAPRTASPAWQKAVLKKWHEPLGTVNLGHEFYGGDLWGIIDCLPLLFNLGVTGLYLTPVFSAPSSHRYDVTDYEQVDVHLGGNEALIKLSQELHRYDRRLILDGVFNHCGVNHPWFQQAAVDPASPTRSFFTFGREATEYVSWLGHKQLPKLDYASQRLRDLMFRNPDSIAQRWLDKPFEVDGWRLDAPNMLGVGGTNRQNRELWSEFRQCVKSRFPQAWIMGECFPEGTEFLQGDTFDAVMNYKGFTIPTIQWATGADLHLNPGAIPAEEWAAWVTRMLARIPFALRSQQYNCLSSHDIPRFISRVAERPELYRLALLLQMAFPGVPALYYGEEVELPGIKDPDNRRPMPWDKISEEHPAFDFVRRVIRRRAEQTVLTHGGFCLLVACGDLVAFGRYDRQRVVVTAANRGEHACPVCVPLQVFGLMERAATTLVLSSLDAAHPELRLETGQLEVSLGAGEAVWVAVELPNQVVRAQRP